VSGRLEKNTPGFRDQPGHAAREKEDLGGGLVVKINTKKKTRNAVLDRGRGKFHCKAIWGRTMKKKGILESEERVKEKLTASPRESKSIS